MNRVELYPLFQEFKTFGEGLVDGVHEIMQTTGGEFTFSQVENENLYVRLFYSESTKCFHISSWSSHGRDKEDPFEVRMIEKIISFFSKKELNTFVLAADKGTIPLSPKTKKMLDIYEILAVERKGFSSRFTTTFHIEKKYNVRWQIQCNFDTGTWDVYDDNVHHRTAPKHCSLSTVEEAKEFLRFIEEGQMRCKSIFEKIKMKALDTNRLQCIPSYEKMSINEYYQTISCEIEKKYSVMKGWYEQVSLRFLKSPTTFYLYENDTLDEMFRFIENIAETFSIKEQMYTEILKFDPYFYDLGNTVVLLGKKYVDGFRVSYDFRNDMFSVSHDKEHVSGDKEDIVSEFTNHFRKKYASERLKLTFEDGGRYAYHRDKVTWLFGNYPNSTKWVLDEDVTLEEIETNVKEHFKEKVFVKNRFENQILIEKLIFKKGEYSNHICVSHEKKENIAKKELC